MYEVWAISPRDNQAALISTGLSLTQAEALVNNLNVEGVQAWKEEE